MSTQQHSEICNIVGGVFSKIIAYVEQTLKKNRLLKTIEYKTNEESTKYVDWNMQIEI